MQIKDGMEWLLDEYVAWIQFWQETHNYARICEDIINQTAQAMIFDSWFPT